MFSRISWDDLNPQKRNGRRMNGERRTWVAATCQMAGGDAAAGDVAGRPRPLEVEPADPAVDVEHFADQKQPRAHPRLHRRRIDLGQRDAAGRGLGVVVAARAGRPAAAIPTARARGGACRRAKNARAPCRRRSRGGASSAAATDAGIIVASSRLHRRSRMRRGAPRPRRRRRRRTLRRDGSSR